MSFHGGALGVIIAIISYSKYHKIPILETGDIVCAVVPIGLFFGRITNFINGELWGKETNLSWGVIFPNAGSNPRHPSQLYEAGLEGLALFIILFALVLSNGLKKRGLISGTFLFFYSFSRILVENFREPDLHIGYIFLNITMGMILSLPFLIAGLILIFQSLKMNILKKKIHNLINENGPISLAKFMEISLGDEKYGYYTKNATWVWW